MNRLIYVSFLLLSILSCNKQSPYEENYLYWTELTSFMQKEFKIDQLGDKKILLIPIYSCDLCVKRALEYSLINSSNESFIVVYMAYNEKGYLKWRDDFDFESVRNKKNFHFDNHSAHLNYELPVWGPTLITTRGTDHFYFELKDHNINEIFDSHQLKTAFTHNL